MKSYITKEYGEPSQVVKFIETVKPQPTKNQVLIKVKAAPVNDYDWSVVSGQPFSYRLLFGLKKPRLKFQKLGMELAGIVEAVGPEGQKFKIGDEVYGDVSNHEFGCFSEYHCVNENALTLKPKNMSFVEAASIPHATMLAYEAMVDLGKMQSGQKVLINGAGGGMGTFGVQLAKMFDTQVTAVDSGEKLDLLKGLGADHVIDYQKQDFTSNGEKYDLIIDPRMNRSPLSFFRSLKKGGNYITVGGKSRRMIQLLFMKGLIRLFTGKSVKILALKSNKYLDEIKNLYEQGKIKPIIDGPHPFDQLPAMIKKFGEAKHKGKVVITIET